MRGTRSSKQHRRNKTRRGKRGGGLFNTAFTTVRKTAIQAADKAREAADKAREAASQAAINARQKATNAREVATTRLGAVRSSVDRMTTFSKVISRLTPEELTLLLDNMLGSINEERKQQILNPNQNNNVNQLETADEMQ